MSDPSSTTKSILLKAAKLENPAERLQYLQSVCGSDNERLQRIATWLDNDHCPHNSPLDLALDQLHSSGLSQVGRETASDEPSPHRELDWSTEDLVGKRMGPYEIVELLGHGGMGTVYLARQTAPIQRNVALKLISYGAYSRQLATYFEAERRTLELMQHPGIASVLDAGTTPWGAPYFIMELVSGQRITDYCNRHELSLDGRLRLFVDVCLAVQHAHQKGIVHRDIKPSNVLVSEHDGKASVKIIDFGIAQAIEQAADLTISGRNRFQVTGTPLYMSPEQATSSPAAVDTRSDVYSLGVLLYELLSRTTPFDRNLLCELEGDHLWRVIQEEVPPRPSSRLPRSQSSDARRLRFELDWIVMKAMQKEPAQRYPTATALAEDIQRYLDYKAIRARPSSWRYRTVKWLTAHKTAFATSLIIAASMMVGTVLSLRSARDARLARDASQSLLFAADMKIASEALRDANIRPARERLERHIPKPGEPDRRNFAWYYLWNQLNPETAIFKTDSHLFEIRFTPDGQHFATGHENGEVLIWRVGSDRPIYRLDKHPDIVRCIAFSPEGSRLATGSDDGHLRLWNLGETTPTFSFQAHSDDVYGIVWIDEDQFVTAGDRDVKFWSWSHFQRESNRTDRYTRTAPIEVPTPDKIIGPLPDLVYAIAISPSGNEIAVASGSFSVGKRGLVTCWDVHSVRETSRQELEFSPITMAYHPEGDRLAVGTRQGDICILETDIGGQLLFRSVDTDRHSSNVYRISFSTDGSRMVSASKDATLRLWNTADWNCELTIQSHHRRVYAADFLPGTHTFASASADGTIRFFESSNQSFAMRHLPFPLEECLSRSKRPLTQYPIRNPYKAQYLRNKDCFILCGNTWDNGFLDPRTGEFTALRFPSALRIAVSNNERYMVANIRDGVVFHDDRNVESFIEGSLPPIDLDGDGVLDRVSGFGNDSRLVWQRGLSSDNSRYAPPSLYGRKPPRRLRRVAKFPSSKGAVTYSFDEWLGRLAQEWLEAGCLVDYEVIDDRLPRDTLWQMVDGKAGEQPTQLLAIPGQGTIRCFPESRREQSFEIETGLTGITAIHGFSLDDSKAIDCLIMAVESRELFIFRREHLTEFDDAGGQPNKFAAVQQLKCPGDVWELDVTRTESGQIQLHAAGPQGIFSYEFSDGRWMEQAHQNQLIEGNPWAKPLTLDVVVYDTKLDQMNASFYSPEHSIWAMAVSDDGQAIATAGDGSFIRLWNASGHLIGCLPVPKNAKHSMAFCPKSDRLCAGVGDEIYIYDIQRQTLLHRLTGHENSVGILAISPSKEILATASHDLTVRLWSIQTGLLLAVLVGHTSIPQSLAFNADERLLATADEKGIVKLWDIETGGELLELRDFKTHAQCLAFDTPTSLSVLGWDDAHNGDHPVIHFGRWTIAKDKEILAAH